MALKKHNRPAAEMSRRVEGGTSPEAPQQPVDGAETAEAPADDANKPAGEAEVVEEVETTEEIVPADAAPADAAQPAEAAEPSAAAPRSERRVRANDLPHVMARIFDTPLLIDSGKLDVILAALGPRLNLLMAPAYLVPAGTAIEGDIKPGRVDLLGAEAQMIASAFGEDDDNGDACPYDVTADGIACINVDGTLVYKSSWLASLSGMQSYSSIADAVTQAADDPSVKGIVLMIGSNGGEASGCFDASDAIFAARSKKPLYGVATDRAFSGGYALLAAASKIFVSRTGGVGSIGVACAHVDQTAQDKMEGLKYTYVYSGARKLDGNPHMALSDEARENMQSESDRLRGLFAASVAKYRGMSIEAVLDTQAGTFFGENAVGAKLADVIGTPADALAAMRAEIGAKAAPSTTLVEAAPAAHAVEAAPAAVVEAPAVETADIRPAAEVVELDTVRRAARGESANLHVEIVELCMPAEEPQLAAEFIRTGIGIDQVREKLQMRRVDASNARNVSGHILPDAGENSPARISAGWEKAILAVRGKLR
jgi:signal peptide peptidase SppA